MSNRTKPIPGYSDPSATPLRLLVFYDESNVGEHNASKAHPEAERPRLDPKPQVQKTCARPDERHPASFSVGSLESKILCAHHNHRLSHLDGEALTAFKAFEIMHYAAIGDTLAPERVYSVDGDLFDVDA